jgi:hypothetical protein
LIMRTTTIHQPTLAGALSETLQAIFKELKQHCDRLGIDEGDGWADTLEPVYDELVDDIELSTLSTARRKSLDALVSLFYSNWDDGRVGLRGLMGVLEELDSFLATLRANVTAGGNKSVHRGRLRSAA